MSHLFIYKKNRIIRELNTNNSCCLSVQFDHIKFDFLRKVLYLSDNCKTQKTYPDKIKNIMLPLHTIFYSFKILIA